METLTGKTQEEVRVILNAFLGSKAYSEVEHMKFLTEIDPAYLRERLTDAFGLAGYGWHYEYSHDDLSLDSETKEGKSGPYRNYIATIKIFRFYYRYRELPKGEIQISAPIISAGGSDNRDPGSALKGAITSGLSAAAKMLLWQLEVYKGNLSHRNAGAIEKAGNGRSSKEPKAPSTAGMKADIGMLRATALSDPAEITPTEFWSFAKIAGIDKELGNQIRSETQSWADALIKAIDQYGGILIERASNEEEA